ncbi:MAG: rhomboid family intramembrane serine protease, partial [Saprospiraceae bacterium]|nr:rhomboid family intramembrane serine protease [Saprospiraceae bacterium]
MSYYQFYQPFSGVVRHLIIINALMFVGTYVIMGPEHWNGHEYDVLGRLQLAAFLPGSEHFQPYQIATHMFMHGDIMHLAFNMFTLYIFGPMVEMAWGHRRFLFYYLFCGVGA